MTNRRFSEQGQMLILLIVLIVIIGAGFMAGGFAFKKPPEKLDSGYTSNLCCDSGDGDSCSASEANTFEWKGTNAQPERYGLIKSNVQLIEGSGHLDKVAAPDDKTPEGQFIFTNVTEKFVSYCSTSPRIGDGPNAGYDSIDIGGKCIPNDAIIYVCRSCNPNGVLGTGEQFDAYYRLSDGEIPDPIKNCSKMPVALTTGTVAVNPVNAKKEDNLQLQTLTFSAPGVAPWLSPWCKPAVYLYPKETSLISVKIISKEPLSYTDPLYPTGGWTVLAEPNGIINYNNKPIDYLYYETKVADNLLTKPDKGFVTSSKELESLLRKILPKLGLNIRETNQFVSYWTKTLPASNYYFVGIIPQDKLSEYSILDVIPKPETELRVTLYFETLATNDTYVEEPIFSTPERSGFTVVEWGGIFKKNKNEKFSCFQ